MPIPWKQRFWHQVVVRPVWPDELALFAKDLSPTQRATFRCWFNRRTRPYDVPTENCIYRVLEAMPVEAFQRAVWAWHADRLLELLRLYWSIESGTHDPLDISAGEDVCRIRQPTAVTVPGILRRAVQGEVRAWARRQRCQRDRNFPTDAARMSRRIDQDVGLAAGAPEGL